MRYTFPPQAKFGKVIPKKKIYEHASVSASLKEKFVTQIEKIVWSYKLAEETINVPETPKVPEIEIFDIYLKGDTVDEALIKAIDKAIPLPIFFYIHCQDAKVQLKAAYKRPSEADSRKWVIEHYFESAWLDAQAEQTPLPAAVDLEKLYTRMIKALMPQTVVQYERTDDIEAEVEQARRIEAKEREYTRLKAKRDKEKQFNKKVELNEKLHRLKQEIIELKREGTDDSCTV